MKLSKSVSVVLLFTLFTFSLTAQEKSQLSFDMSADVAYYPLSDRISNSQEDNVQFAPITGPYSGLEARIVFNGTYVIQTPLGNHWLLQDANVAITESFELTPVSIKPSTQISFTPVPFLVINGGFQIGTGWNCFGIQGMAEYSPTAKDTNNYEDLTTFGNLFAKYWAQATIQFDTGVIWEGDWNHLQMLYTYQVYYEGLTGMADQQLWKWLATGNKVNGVKEYQQAVIAYQMPLMLSRVGIIFESDRYYSDDAYFNKNFNCSKNIINISGMAQLTLTEKDMLTFVLNFATRNSYSTYSDDFPESAFNSTGTEWYFKRIGISYAHKF